MSKAIKISLIILLLPALAYAATTDPHSSEEGVIRFTLDIDWWYALTTLVFRFLMIFVMLLLLQVAMQLSGFIFTQADGKKLGKAEPDPDILVAEQKSGEVAGGEAAPSKGLNPEIAAAIGMALYQATHVPAGTVSTASSFGPSLANWASTGRSMQFMANQQFGDRKWIKRSRKLR